MTRLTGMMMRRRSELDAHRDLVVRERLPFAGIWVDVAGHGVSRGRPGFTGGALLLVDILPYMHRRALSFDDVFEWSQEATEGSKPVLRARHRLDALAECGIEIGAPGPGEIIFVNNSPGAGVLHGVKPVTVADPATFRREYHRCTVKDLRLC